MAHVSDCAGTPLKEENVGFASLPLGECLFAAAAATPAVISHRTAERERGGRMALAPHFSCKWD